MRDRIFVDTNFIVYLYSNTEAAKRDAAYSIVNKNLCVASTQILNEASNVWFKKYKWSKYKIAKHLDNIEIVCDEITLIRRETINLALELKDRYGYAYYDCLILASSLESNCETVYTEDMADGQLINNRLKIVNPFKDL